MADFNYANENLVYNLDLYVFSDVPCNWIPKEGSKKQLSTGFP